MQCFALQEMRGISHVMCAILGFVRKVLGGKIHFCLLSIAKIMKHHPCSLMFEHKMAVETRTCSAGKKLLKNLLTI